MATCRDCKLYDLDATRNKAGVVLRKRAARCLWTSREQWPLSVLDIFYDRPKPSLMLPDEGERCPCFQKRDIP